jgi:hypothetical protein
MVTLLAHTLNSTVFCSDICAEIRNVCANIFFLNEYKMFSLNVICFHRGFKTVGPFVVMIYRMIMGDLLRFVSIYLVFVMGFSQCKCIRENKMKQAYIPQFQI